MASHSSSDETLNLSCSDSSFDEDGEPVGLSSRFFSTIEPYMHEPEASTSGSDEHESAASSDETRLGNTMW